MIALKVTGITFTLDTNEELLKGTSSSEATGRLMSANLMYTISLSKSICS
jgi:hypothetical protein